MARMGLKQWDGAIAAFQEGIRMDPNHLHSAAHYLLAQALLRAGRQDEAQQELQQHQQREQLRQLLSQWEQRKDLPPAKKNLK